MGTKPTFGFILEYVTDIEAARRFYVDVLGLEVERYHPTYVQFKNFAIANDSSQSGTREPEVYWLVDDVQAAYEELSQKTEIILPLKQEAYGTVFGIRDPAGRPLYLLEFAQNRPSQAVA